MSFIPLHIRSSYSFLKSGILFKNLFEMAKECGYEELGLTDLGVMYGLPEFVSFAKANNISPILGMDVKCDKYFFSLFIQNETGYSNLSHITSLISKAHLEQKEITFAEILPYLDGLICVLPIDYNAIFKEVNNNLKDELLKLSKVFKHLFIGIEIYHKEEIPHVNLIREFALKYAYETIAFPYIRYLKKDDAIVINMLDAIRLNTTIEQNTIPTDSDFFFKTKEEILKFYTPLELKDCDKIKDLIDFDFNKKRGELIHYLDKDEEETRLYFINLIKEGAKKHNLDLNNKVYKHRLNYEYQTIKNLGYINYFLVVQDYVNFAKNNGIPVGPGRGSAAGSLISYCLGITDVDPIKYNLLFERFLNAKRNSLPDIDIDISDIRREEIISYLINKYGNLKVARVCAFQTIAAKQAIRDTARVYGFPASFVNDLSKTIPNNFKDENAKNFSLDYAYEHIPAFKKAVNSDIDYKFIFKQAHYIEGLPRQRGLHAAGIILNQDELSKNIPVDYENEYELVTQYEKNYLEKQGFLKMDILGLSNLTVIDNCLKKIEKTRKTLLKMEDIPYDTPEIFKLISEFKTMGIFQLDTSAAYNAIVNIRPNSFLDVVATISLDRPGPMQFIPTFSRRKHGQERISYLSKSLEPILKETYGIIVYQEQIMQIAQAYASFSFSDADIFRKAISKKDKHELLEMRQKFIKGSVANGHSGVEANTLFEQILKFANYGFNKSHAVAYAMIACKEAYLKANYPIEFYCAILDQQYGSNDTKFSRYLAEIRSSKLKVYLPNINESTVRFEMWNNGLLMPLLGINNLPSRVIISIIQEREKHGPYDSFINFVIRMTYFDEKISDTVLAKLIDAGAFDTLHSNRKALKMSIPNAIQYASMVKSSEGKLLNDFGIEYHIPEVIDDPIERLDNECAAVGVMISDSPLNHLPDELKNLKHTLIGDLKVGQTTTIVGIVRSIKNIVVKNGKDKGKPMAFVTIFDESGDVDTTFFSSIWSTVVSDIEINKIIVISGRYEMRNNLGNFLVGSVKVV